MQIRYQKSNNYIISFDLFMGGIKVASDSKMINADTEQDAIRYFNNSAFGRLSKITNIKTI